MVSFLAARSRATASRTLRPLSRSVVPVSTCADRRPRQWSQRYWNFKALSARSMVSFMRSRGETVHGPVLANGSMRIGYFSLTPQMKPISAMRRVALDLSR